MNAWRDCTLAELLHVKHGFALLGEHFGDSGTHITEVEEFELAVAHLRVPELI